MGKMINVMEIVVEVYVVQNGKVFDLFNEIKVQYYWIMDEFFFF